MYIVYKHNIAAKQKHDIYYTHTHSLSHTHFNTYTLLVTHTHTLFDPPVDFSWSFKKALVFSPGPTLFGFESRRLSKRNIMKIVNKVLINFWRIYLVGLFRTSTTKPNKYVMSLWFLRIFHILIRNWFSKYNSRNLT